MRIRYIDIDIDTLRPDHLGAHGYHRDTSPNIDAVAARLRADPGDPLHPDQHTNVVG